MIQLDKIKPLTEPTSKRRQIYEALRREIAAQRLPSGSQIPTTHELADRYAVAYNTVHFALDDLVRDGCLVRHRGKGTFVAAAAGPKKRPLSSDLVAVLPAREDIVTAGTATELFQVLSGCTAGAAACGGRIGMVSLPSVLQPADVPAALQQLLPHDGAIFDGAPSALLIQELARQRFPMVIVGQESDLAPWVSDDRQAATQLGVTHLLEHGYRRIGFFGKLTGVKYQYFCQMLAQHGIAVDPAVSQQCGHWHEAHKAALRFLGVAPLPEAVFVENPHMARMLVQVAQSRGLTVPRDLAMLAYGADPVAAELSLSCVAVPYEDIGREAAILLDQLVRGRRVAPAEKLLPAQLALRNSCGCKPPVSPAQADRQTTRDSGGAAAPRI